MNPALIDSRYKGVSKCKFDALDKIVNHCLKRNEKVVIYSPNFTNGVLKELEKRYGEHGALRIDGENIREREKGYYYKNKEKNMDNQ